MGRVLEFYNLQQEMIDWQQHNFPNREPWIPLLGMVEELGELAHSYIKRHQGIRGTTENHRRKMKDAVGDILIFMADFCNSQNFDMQQCLDDAWEEVKLRDWQQFPTNGVSE